MEQRFAFVLRIWLTDSAASTGATTGMGTGMSTGQKPGALRGTLQSIHSTEPSYFNSLRQLNELLEAALQQSEPPSSSTESTA